MSSDTLDVLVREHCSRPNPFLVLGAVPGAHVSELRQLCRDLCLRAGSREDELSVREALRQLTQMPVNRCMWSLFTPHVAALPETDRQSVGAVELGRFLGVGDGSEPHCRRLLEIFMTWLGWDRVPLGSGLPPQVPVLWEGVWRARGHHWECWHQLALLYTARAVAQDAELSAHEAACGNGQGLAKTGKAKTSGVVALWCRAFRCWVNALAAESLWQAVAAAGGSEVDETTLADLRRALPNSLVQLLAQRLRSALDLDLRLTAARHARMLYRLGTESEYSPFAAAAGAAVEDLCSQLWVQILGSQQTARDRLTVLERLLLIRPDDTVALDKALAAMGKLVGEDHETGLAACRRLEPRIEPLLRRENPGLPAAPELDPALMRRLPELDWFLVVMTRLGSESERRRYGPVLAVWKAREEEEQGATHE